MSFLSSDLNSVCGLYWYGYGSYKIKNYLSNSKNGIQKWNPKMCFCSFSVTLNCGAEIAENCTYFDSSTTVANGKYSLENIMQ